MHLKDRVTEGGREEEERKVRERENFHLLVYCTDKCTL